ncbi:hypothetical protein J7L02_01970, partial [Candidatus Woesearchaeota archaeon]|nr:hypothetical protein [Candidatus Woesearchaeota archaeon]
MLSYGLVIKPSLGDMSQPQQTLFNVTQWQFDAYHSGSTPNYAPERADIVKLVNFSEPLAQQVQPVILQLQDGWYLFIAGDQNLYKMLPNGSLVDSYNVHGNWKIKGMGFCGYYLYLSLRQSPNHAKLVKLNPNDLSVVYEREFSNEANATSGFITCAHTACFAPVCIEQIYRQPNPIQSGVYVFPTKQDVECYEQWNLHAYGHRIETNETLFWHGGGGVLVIAPQCDWIMTRGGQIIDLDWWSAGWNPFVYTEVSAILNSVLPQAYNPHNHRLYVYYGQLFSINTDNFSLAGYFPQELTYPFPPHSPVPAPITEEGGIAVYKDEINNKNYIYMQQITGRFVKLEDTGDSLTLVSYSDNVWQDYGLLIETYPPIHTGNGLICGAVRISNGNPWQNTNLGVVCLDEDMNVVWRYVLAGKTPGDKAFANVQASCYSDPVQSDDPWRYAFLAPPVVFNKTLYLVIPKAVDHQCNGQLLIIQEAQPGACGNCYDSDGGINYFTPGNVSGTFENCSSFNVQDYCHEAPEEDILTEYYCAGNGYSQQIFDCSSLDKVLIINNVSGLENNSCSWNDSSCQQTGIGGRCFVNNRFFDCDCAEFAVGDLLREYVVTNETCSIGCSGTECCQEVDSVCNLSLNCVHKTIHECFVNDNSQTLYCGFNSTDWAWRSSIPAEDSRKVWESCSDTVDNDCDFESDWDSYYTGNHGDKGCPVKIESIEAPDQVCPGETFIIACNTTPGAVNSIIGEVGLPQYGWLSCNFVGWKVNQMYLPENTVYFNCTAPNINFTVRCRVDTSKS